MLLARVDQSFYLRKEPGRARTGAIWDVHGAEMSDVPVLSETELKADIFALYANALSVRLEHATQLAGYPVEAVGRSEFGDTYFDTDDFQVYRHRGYVRLREDDRGSKITYRHEVLGVSQQQIVEVTRPSAEFALVADALRHRIPNLPSGAGPSNPEASLRQLGLNPVVRLHTERLELRLAGTRSPIRLKLDGSVYQAEDLGHYQLEVDFYSQEHGSAAARVFDHLVAISEGQMRITTTSKLDRGLALRRLRGFRLG